MIRSQQEPESRPDAPTGAGAAWNDLFQVVRATCARLGELEPVREYVAQFPDVAPLAGALLRSARGEFGPQAELVFQLYRDPEINDAYLGLLVRLPRYEKDFLDRIHSITDAHDEKLADISGFISVSSDYRQPSAIVTI